MYITGLDGLATFRIQSVLIDLMDLLNNIDLLDLISSIGVFDLIILK